MDIKTRVRAFILDELAMVPPATPLTDAASLRKLNLLDSTGVLELVAFLEGEFGIRFGDGELAPGNLDTLDAIEAFVSSKLASADRAA